MSSLTYREIKQQYDALRRTFDYMNGRRDDIVRFFRERPAAAAAFVGCGSSYCLSQSAALSLRLRAGVPSLALAGGDVMLSPERYASLFADGVLVAPSRSGSTTEVVEAVRLLRSGGRRVPVLALSCVENSPLAAEADLVLELPWAFDASVCQTRTVTNLYTANLLIAAFTGGDDALVRDIDAAIAQGEAYMARVEEGVRAAASFDWTNGVVLADGELQGLAAEGAIALTEIATISAHSYHLLDVRHGPMVGIGPQTLVIAALNGGGGESVRRHQEKLMADLKARGARIIAFADRAEAIPEAHVDYAAVAGGPLDPAAQGIPFIFLAQIAAIAGAERRGINPDAPDGLTAWVKL